MISGVVVASSVVVVGTIKLPSMNKLLEYHTVMCSE